MIAQMLLIGVVLGLGITYGFVFRKDTQVGVGRYAVGTWPPLFVGLYFLWGWVQVYVFTDQDSRDYFTSHVWSPDAARASDLRELYWGAIICTVLAILGRTALFLRKAKEPGRWLTYAVDVVGLGLVILFAVYFLTLGLEGKLGLYVPGLCLVVSWSPAAALARRLFEWRRAQPGQKNA